MSESDVERDIISSERWELAVRLFLVGVILASVVIIVMEGVRWGV